MTLRYTSVPRSNAVLPDKLQATIPTATASSSQARNVLVPSGANQYTRRTVILVNRIMNVLNSHISKLC